MSTYESHGIEFDFPDDWQLTEAADESHVAISIESPGSAFWMLSIIQGRPSADDVVASALESLQEEHEECDVYDSTNQICMLPTAAFDVDFECAEMINRASIMACETDRVTLFVMHQCPQTEEADFKRDLLSITDSLMWDTEDDPGFDPLAYDNLAGLEP
jgi:hypothetical protein